MRLKKGLDFISRVDLIVALGAKECRMMIGQVVFVQVFGLPAPQGQQRSALAGQAKARYISRAGGFAGRRGNANKRDP